MEVGSRRVGDWALEIGDVDQNCGYDALRVMRKGGRRDALAINPQTTALLAEPISLSTATTGPTYS
jgi:hypothetical protein